MGNFTNNDQPKKWLCRLGPWNKVFEPGQEVELANWCQEKSQWYAYYPDDLRDAYATNFAQTVQNGQSIREEAFGRSLSLDPLPLPTQIKRPDLPKFYEWSDIGSWTDVEVEGVICEDGHCERVSDDANPHFYSVFLRLEAGGCYCVADLATKEQANGVAAVIWAAASSFIPTSENPIVHL